MRLWAVMCPHERKEWFWGIKARGLDGSGEGGAWGAALKEPGPSNALSLQLSSPKGITHFEFLCFFSFAQLGNLLWPCCQHEDQCPITPRGTLLWVPSASALQVHPELLLGHFLPHPNKIRTILFSCLASGEEQAPAERIFNSLYSTPQCVNSGLPGSLLHPSPLLLSIPLQKISGF